MWTRVIVISLIVTDLHILGQSASTRRCKTAVIHLSPERIALAWVFIWVDVRHFIFWLIDRFFAAIGARIFCRAWFHRLREWMSAEGGICEEEATELFLINCKRLDLILIGCVWCLRWVMLGHLRPHYIKALAWDEVETKCSCCLLWNSGCHRKC